ncbi:Protein IWS1 -like protein IWS1-like protein [Triplophysa tibetana]|uniref:Protein IWS1-like protein IWS1-like protein n=1 Tax=Triplophysa tibetana TaxID=1572043 RepID=A0A5A9N1J8_9TELE|nr:Protein IWS1 -like protein IWS1-like protein [Triplophysa tibetana]
MDGDEDVRSDGGSVTPVQDEQEDVRPESRQSDDDVTDNEDEARERKSENSGSDHEARDGGDGSDSEPDPPRPADSDDEERSSPIKRRASTSDNEEEKPQPASDSDHDDQEKRSSPKSDAGSDSDEDKPKQSTQRTSDEEDEERKKGKWKAVMNSDSEEEEEKPKEEAGSDQDEAPKRNALDSEDDEGEDKPVKRKKAVLSDSDEDEEKEVKKSRLVSDDEDSGSDDGSGAPDKSLAAKLKELGSDSEEEEDTSKAEGENKDEKALFGSDSESGGDDEEEKMIADIFGESGDEEEFTGFNQEELEGEQKHSQEEGQKQVDNSDSDDDIDRGKDMSFMSDFDIMLARKKAQGGKRRRNRDGGTFISDADDVVSAMITKMTEAAEEDRTLNSQKKPALKKLMLLPTVVMHLKKQDLKDTFIDSGVMMAIKEWISPLPDRSLPALKIRAELLRILQELPSVSQETLKLSGIGRSVMFLYKHPKESRANKDLALKLINEWSRPIFGLTSNYKGMTREERQQRDLDQQIAPRRRLSSGGQTPRRDLDKVLTGEEKALRPGDPGFCARARVPMPSNKDYVVRPRWNVDMDSGRGPLKKGVSRVDKQMRRFQDIKRLTKPGHAVKISVEGNRMPL